MMSILTGIFYVYLAKPVRQGWALENAPFTALTFSSLRFSFNFINFFNLVSTLKIQERSPVFQMNCMSVSFLMVVCPIKLPFQSTELLTTTKLTHFYETSFTIGFQEWLIYESFRNIPKCFEKLANHLVHQAIFKYANMVSVQKHRLELQSCSIKQLVKNSSFPHVITYSYEHYIRVMPTMKCCDLRQSSTFRHHEGWRVSRHAISQFQAS